MTFLREERTVRAEFYAPEKVSAKMAYANTGMDVKSAQYLMDHSDTGTTLDIYTDNIMDKVYESMELLEKRCN